MTGENPDIAGNAKKSPLIPTVNICLRGCVSDEVIHISSLTSMPVLSTTPIDYYYDGGIVRATW